jgi:hypothetical protein
MDFFWNKKNKRNWKTPVTRTRTLHLSEPYNSQSSFETTMVCFFVPLWLQESTLRTTSGAFFSRFFSTKVTQLSSMGISLSFRKSLVYASRLQAAGGWQDSYKNSWFRIPLALHQHQMICLLRGIVGQIKEIKDAS